MPEVISSHTNTEGERATIERVESGPFEGRMLLVIHDDPPSFVTAPMLLDEGTVAWLQAALSDSSARPGSAGGRADA